MMAFLKTVLLFFLCCFCISAQGSAAVPLGHEGTDFWLCFQKNYRKADTSAHTYSDPLFLELSISTEQTTNVEVELPALKFHTTLRVEAGTRRSVFFPEDASLYSDGIAKNAAIHLTAEKPVTVVGLSSRFQTTDSYSAYPVNALGMQYRVVGYGRLSDDLISQAAVVATEDNTVVTFTPPASAQQISAKSNSVRLNKGDVYQIFADANSATYSDITGTLISADKKVAVFSGHSCAYVPINVQACNHLVEQLPPIDSWGKEFYAQQLPHRQRYSLRIIASEENTTLSIASGESERNSTLAKAGDFQDMSNLRGSFSLKSDKPVMLVQYSHGFRGGDSVGDPSMMLIRPVEQYKTEYTIIVPYFPSSTSTLIHDIYPSAEAETAAEIQGCWQHHLMVVVPPAGLGSLQMNGTPVNPDDFHPIAGNMMAGVIRLTGTCAKINCEFPFGITQYGTGSKAWSFDAYGHGW